jgi:hypothetical protein
MVLSWCMRKFKLIASALLVWSLAAPAQEEIPMEIRGVYGHPGPLWEKGVRLDDGVSMLSLCTVAPWMRRRSNGCTKKAVSSLLN